MSIAPQQILCLEGIPSHPIQVQLLAKDFGPWWKSEYISKGKQQHIRGLSETLLSLGANQVHIGSNSRVRVGQDGLHVLPFVQVKKYIWDAVVGPALDTLASHLPRRTCPNNIGTGQTDAFL